MSQTPNHDLLWDYLDGFLSTEEYRQVDLLIRQSPEWQQALNEVQAQREMLKQTPTDTTRAGFADRVMAAWVAEQSAAGKFIPKTGHTDWIIQVISWTFAVLLLTPIAGVLITGLGIQMETPEVFTDALEQAHKTQPFSLDQVISNAGVQIVLYMALGLLGARFLNQWFQTRLSSIKV